MIQTGPAAIVLFAVITSNAFAQFVPVDQERSVQTSVSVSSGDSDGDSVDSPNFGLFSPHLTSSVTGPFGASAAALGAQSSAFSSASISGVLEASSDVATGSTFITGESFGQSNLLFFFSLTAPTQVRFLATGTIGLLGADPNGEPSDLYGFARARLLDSATLDMIAGFNFGPEAGTQSEDFIGMLPAGEYVILAAAQTHAYSADLLGPPARSGSADSLVSFSLTVVPAPGGVAVLGLGLTPFARRRR